MIYFLLAYEFIKIGLFSFGGGYATIPFLYDIAVRYGWYSVKELANMTAIASITPGPVGINAATYAGINTAGILGAVIATLFEIIPALLMVIFVSKLLKKFSNNFYLKALLDTLKPISCALLISVAYYLFSEEIKNIHALILLGILLILSLKNKKDTLFYMGIGALYGIIKIFI